MPVTNKELKLIGLLSWKDVENYIEDSNLNNISIEDIMQKDIIITDEWMLLSEAKSLMDKYNINSLPVVKTGKLIGIITSKDI